MNADTILGQLRERGVNPAGLSIDSRQIAAGDVFLAWPGASVDGRRFIPDAVGNGAAAVLYEAINASTVTVPVPAIAVPNLAIHAGDLAHRVYGQPSEHLWLAGVTGTNGKTSVCQWIAQALDSLGQRCATIGTLGNGFVDGLDASLNTTPDAVSLHRNLAAYRAAGADACAMEVSSIGLDQGRVNGACFQVAVFTNLTRDHLEYHSSMEAYAAAKAKLFDWPGLKSAVLNLDDSLGRQLAEKLRGHVITWGYTLEGREGTDHVLRAEDLAMTDMGMEFKVAGQSVRVSLVGRFNVSNLLAVFAVLRAKGVDGVTAATALGRLHPPPGRMQRLAQAGQPLVVVDYAHTPDALKNALATLRETARARGGKLICLFGCGGDRDPGKRPEMGVVAESYADQVVVTSDNPRSENTDDIIAGIVSGMKSSPVIEPDRAAAIRKTLAAAQSADVLLLAGKGHEPYQEIAGRRLPFSDMEQARLALECRS